MTYYAGVDIGSLGTKSIILNENKEIVGKAVVPTGARVAVAAEESLAKSMEMAGIKKSDITYTVATGYGRKKAGADQAVTEITCHAAGALYFYPDTDTILDIGGQDTKGISIGPNQEVENFAMNDKCAAGTGRFLEVMARALEVDLDELGDLSAKSDNPQTISSFCTVFGESEVISHVAEGAQVNDIILGLHASISQRAVGILKRVGIGKSVTMSGGVAKNSGMVTEIEKVLGMKLNVCEDSQIIGALGAALIAHKKHNANKAAA